MFPLYANRFRDSLVFYCTVWCFTLHHWCGAITAPIRAAVRNVRFPAAAFFPAPAGAMLAGAVRNAR